MKIIKLLLCLLLVMLVGCSSGQKKHEAVAKVKGIEDFGMKAILVNEQHDMLAIHVEDKERKTELEEYLIRNFTDYQLLEIDNQLLLLVGGWSNMLDVLGEMDINKYASDHFVYYTYEDIDRSNELERIYLNLTNKILPDYKEKDGKINYVILPTNIGGPIERKGVNLIVDPWDCSSSHFIIRQLSDIRNYAFTVGYAQMHQLEGNGIMKEQNVNLVMKEYFENGNSVDLLAMIEGGYNREDYLFHAMGSFIFYNTIVMDNSDEFVAFMHELEYSDNLFEVADKYENNLKLDLRENIADWQEWVKTVDESSDIYISWDV